MAFKVFDLTDKVSLVTGGSNGIGLGMAEALTMAGSDVVVWGIEPGHLKQAEVILKAHGRRVLCQIVDVTREQDVVAAITDAVKKFGRIDTVIAAAGILGEPTPLKSMSSDAFGEVLDVNLNGIFWTFREACRHMADRASNGEPGGSIIGIASMAALHGAPGIQAYAASKGAIFPLVRSIAVEYARYGVRANTVVPGWITTNMTRANHESEKFAEKVLPRIPARRWGVPEDLGGIAVYLASDASRYHSGDTIVIDGGYFVF